MQEQMCSHVTVGGLDSGAEKRAWLLRIEP